MSAFIETLFIRINNNCVQMFKGGCALDHVIRLRKNPLYQNINQTLAKDLKLK